MLWILLGLILIAYLPGALLLRVPLADRASRAALSAEERLFWAVILSVAWSSLVVLGLAAAELYSIGRLLLANATVSGLVCVVWRRRLSYGGTASPVRWPAVVPLVLIGVGLLQFFPPSEYVIGGKDPGVYVNEGIAIAQHGSLRIHDPVAVVPAAARDLFFPPYPGQAYYSLRFMGFWLLDPLAGTVIGQFPHLLPAWVAVGYGLDGLAGARQVVGWWAILGLLAVYFSGARLLGRGAAAAAALLLGLSLIQVWFARYPNSEIPMQALVFAALLAFSRAHVDGDRFFGWVAGLLLGLMCFLRVDAVLAVAGVALGAALLATQRRSPQLSFVVPLGVMLAAAWFYLTGVMRAYAARPLGFVANLPPPALALTGAASVALVGVLIASRRPGVAAWLRVWVPRLLALGLLGAAVYAYFLRQPGGRLAAHDASSFRTFAWYLPPEALAVAVAGYAWLVWRRFWRDPALFVTAAVFACFFFYKIQIVPEHFWMARRFLPVIFPSALLMLCGAALYWANREPSREQAGRRRRPAVWATAMRVGLPVAFLCLVGWRLAAASRPIADHVEYAGVISKLEAMAGQFGDQDLVLVEPRWSSDMHVLALPLSYIYSRNVLVLNTPRPDKGRLREFLLWAETRYRRVFFVGGGGVDLLSRSISAEPIMSDRFQVPEYESAANRWPTRVRFKEFDYGVYRLNPSAAPAPLGAIDVGSVDDLSVWRFHAKERMNTLTYRWSKDVSYVALPGLSSDVRSATLWMSNGGRPAGAPPLTVTVFLDEEPLGAVEVPLGFAPYRFAVTPELAARFSSRDDPAVLKLVCSSTWKPRATLGTDDDRDLGVMVDRVEVQ